MAATARTTGDVCRTLGVLEHRLQSLIRFGIIDPPEMVAGRRIWTEQDIEAARAALERRGALSTPEPNAAR